MDNERSNNKNSGYFNLKRHKKMRKKKTEKYNFIHSTNDIKCSNIELAYEKMPRSFNYTMDISYPFKLPIKMKDGRILQKKTSNSLKQTLKIPSNEAPIKYIERKNKRKEKEPIKNIPETLASIAQSIIEHPEENIKQLKTLREISFNQTISIQRLGLLTQLAVYKDIIPGYSIRPLTNIEKASRMSKETKQRSLFEESLILNYYEYICLLSKTIEAGKTFPEDSPQRFLSDISFSCICHLLLSIPHFNYRNILIEIISTKLTQKIYDTSFIECKKTVEEIFKNDTEGKISFEIIKKLTNIIKKKNYNISDSVLNTFLQLEVLSQSNLTASKKDVINPRKRKHEKQFKSKKLRKLEREKKQIEKEMNGNEKSNEDKEKFQGEILKLIFATYFQILQNGLVNLIYASLEGLKKFSHLISVDFFEDLLKVLKELLENTFNFKSGISFKDSTKGGLLCIVTAFKLLSRQAQIKNTINLDLSTFIIYLYSIMIPMSLNSYIETSNIYKSNKHDVTSHKTDTLNNLTEIEIFIECFDYIFFQDKNPNLSKASAFIKRLFTVLLGFPEKSVLKSLNLMQKLIKKHPKLSYLLNSNEKYGDGIYNGEIDNPDLSNSYLSTCWELVLLKVYPLFSLQN
ncbi:hypothetical protein PCANB_000193 [Pneumocystis canis]|nr:hypothetical protein PCANB_000193 [Pneumocystis canis]